MTVQELIDALSEYPPGVPVYLGRQVDREVRLNEIGWVGYAPTPAGVRVVTVAWKDPARNLDKGR